MRKQSVGCNSCDRDGAAARIGNFHDGQRQILIESITDDFHVVLNGDDEMDSILEMGNDLDGCGDCGQDSAVECKNAARDVDVQIWNRHGLIFGPYETSPTRP